MNLEEAKSWLTLVLAIIAILGHAKGWFSSGEKQLDKRVSEIEAETDSLGRRVQTIEGELRHMPTKDQVNDLKLAISDLGGAVSTMRETVASVQRTVHRIDDWLREESKVG